MQSFALRNYQPKRIIRNRLSQAAHASPCREFLYISYHESSTRHEELYEIWPSQRRARTGLIAQATSVVPPASRVPLRSDCRSYSRSHLDLSSIGYLYCQKASRRDRPFRVTW
eukprot:9091253-Pyramimonas_sp.AAC.1